MATLAKSYNLDTSQGWVYVGDGSDAFASGNFVLTASGRRATATGYLELSTTWESLGVTPGNTINEIDSSSFDWLCDIANTSIGYTIGAFEILE